MNTDIELWKKRNIIGQEIIELGYKLDIFREEYIKCTAPCKNSECEHFDTDSVGNCDLGVPFHFCEEYRDTDEEP